MSDKLLSPNHKIVAIGGGHGLSQVLKAFSYLESNLSAIVTTSDNGGSSGRLRKINNNIAWGDIRHCLTSLIDDELALQILNFRFKGSVELGGHNLGNIIFTALEQMGNSPLNAIAYIKQLLDIKANIFPMSEMPVDLKATLNDGTTILGETQIDNLKTAPESLSLYPQIEGIDSAQMAIKGADIIILGPGSFYTSILPPLLITDYASAMASTNAKIIFIDNIAKESSPADFLSLEQKVLLLEDKLKRKLDKIISPVSDNFLDSRVNIIPQSGFLDDGHCITTLAETISNSLLTNVRLASAS